jgi:ribosomal-protein-alanine N-acetyltransferase
MLETARLWLEPIRADHADAMFAGLAEPSLYRYETDEPPASLDELRDRYARLAEGASPADQIWLNWILMRRDGSGAAGYVQATVEADRSWATIGYVILAGAQRRGFGVEAVGAMVRHLLAEHVAAIEAVIDIRNAASIALVERLGFVRHATHRSDDVIGGVRGFDHDYVLVNPEAERAR